MIKHSNNAGAHPIFQNLINAVQPNMTPTTPIASAARRLRRGFPLPYLPCRLVTAG